jgi:hypothetical protein
MNIKLANGSFCIALILITHGVLFGELPQKPLLRDFKYSHYSQFGEDGIIEKIFEAIGTTSKLCVECGAWDGLKYANTAYLWKHKNWRAILIEADQNKHEELLKNIVGYNCLPVCAYLGREKYNSIDTILAALNINEPIDLMSIDIDGDDYYIFESLTVYRPRVIICEHNPTLPAQLDIYQDYGDYFGCSTGALVRLGKSKGYTLVATTETNSFFVDDASITKLDNFEIALDKIAINTYTKYIAYSYAGMPVILSETAAWSFAFEAHFQGYPSKLHHKHGILRIKNWEPGNYEV